MRNSTDILTERLTLRRFNEGDAEAMLGILSDQEMKAFLPWFPPESLEEAKRHLRENHHKKYEISVGFLWHLCKSR